MFKLTVNTSSLSGKVLRIFFFGTKPQTTCSAFWTIIACSAVWLLQALITLFAPLYVYAAITKGGLSGVSDYIGENVNTLWLYPFSNFISSDLHSVLSLFFYVELALTAAFGIALGMVLFINWMESNDIRFYRNKDSEPGIIIKIMQDFKNKVCRPIEWR